MRARFLVLAVLLGFVPAETDAYGRRSARLQVPRLISPVVLLHIVDEQEPIGEPVAGGNT